MEQFNSKATCPKCGIKDIGSSYCMGNANNIRCYYDINEHIHRICVRCQYQWVEKCLDDPSKGNVPVIVME